MFDELWDDKNLLEELWDNKNYSSRSYGMTKTTPRGAMG